MASKQKRARVFLKQVFVPRHCPESWDGMTGADKVRHCGTCRTNVYNLSAMSEEEAGRIVDLDEACVRYFYRDDGTIVKEPGHQATRRGSSRLAIGAAVALAYPAAFVGLSAMLGETEGAGHVSIENREGIKLAMGIKLGLPIRPQEFTAENRAELEQLEEIQMSEGLDEEQQLRMILLRKLELRVAVREAEKWEEREPQQDLRPELDEARREKARATRRQLDAMLMSKAARRQRNRGKAAKSRSEGRNAGEAGDADEAKDEVLERIDSGSVPWGYGGLGLLVGFLFLRRRRAGQLQALDAWSIPQVTAVLSLLGAAAAPTVGLGIGLGALGVFSLVVAQSALSGRSERR